MHRDSQHPSLGRRRRLPEARRLWTASTLAWALVLGAAARAGATPRARPVTFEPIGDESARCFLMRGSEYSALIGTDGLRVLASTAGEAASAEGSSQPRRSRELRIRWAEARSGGSLRGVDPLPGVSHRFVGADSRRWRKGVPHFGGVVASEVYEGVDVVCYASEGRLEFDFVVAAGADPGQIRVEVLGARSVDLEADGGLLLRHEVGDYTLHAPYVYQRIDGSRRRIPARYRIVGERSAPVTKLEIEVAAYDAKRPLVIDPVLSYARRLGGSGLDEVQKVAVDAQGNTYLTGYTQSLDFSAPEGEPARILGERGGSDAYVLALSADGQTVIYSTILGGTRFDQGLGIAVDEDGNAYVAGATSFNESGFPTTPDAYRSTPADFFVAKLAPDGGLLYSTFFGGRNIATLAGLAIHGSGDTARVAIVGSTVGGFPTTGNAFRRGLSGPSDVFLSVLEPAREPSSEQLIYSTHFGSDSFDRGAGVAAGPDGRFYVTGTVQGVDMPLRHAFDTTHEVGREAFLAVFDVDLDGDDSLTYSSYVGGSRDENGTIGDGGIAVDASGVAVVVGTTSSFDFPVTPEGYRVSREGADAFLVAVDPSIPGGDSLLYGTYFGGLGADAGTDVAAGPPGTAYLVGYTQSRELPGRGGAPAEKFGAGFLGAGQDAFVAKLDWRRIGSDSLIDAAYVGGTRGDFAQGVAAYGLDRVYVAGTTSSAEAFEPTPGFGSDDGFLACLSLRVQLPDGVLERTGSDLLELDFGTGPYTWSLVSGELPEGLTLDESGVLSGAPRALGDYTFDVEVRDSSDETRRISFGKRILTGASPGDVLIRKAGVVPVPGRTIPYYILLRNRSDRTLHEVGVVEILEYWFELVDASPAPSLVEPRPTGNVYWTIPELRPGQLEVITYWVRLPDDFPIQVEVTGEACLTEEDCGREKAECFEEAKERCDEAGCVGPGSGPSCIQCNKQEGELCQSQWLRCVGLVGGGSSEDLEEGTAGGGCWTDKRRTNRPTDPNEKAVTSSRFVRSGEVLGYTIHFENIGEIEAQDVFLTDVLDEDLDLATLRVLRRYGGLVPLAPSDTVSIFEDDDEIWTVSLDEASRTVTWELLGVDLPPGETDSVLFVIQAPEGLPSGTELINEADIRFEVFETLRTNATENIIDDVPPVATVTPLPPVTFSRSFEVSWTGTDEVGEIELFGVFASTDGGPFVQVQRAFEPGSLLFEGEFGSTYRFLCVARDTAGNVELLDDVAEASTTLEPPSSASFHRGDPNASGTIDISDGIFLFELLFGGGAQEILCRESGNANNDAAIDISDGIYLLNWLFTGGAAPPPPGPTTSPCGPDPDEPGSLGDLGCDAYPPCE